MPYTGLHDSVVLPELHQSWQLAKVIPNPEFFDDNGNGTYSDDKLGFRYSYQGNGTWADANGNSYSTWNDEESEIPESNWSSVSFQGVNGTVDIKETTNGDYRSS